MAWSRSNDRGYDHHWRKLRKQVLAEEPTCRICTVRLATECDHIKPKSKGGTNDRANLQGVCRSCHAEKTAQEAAEARGVALRYRPTIGLDGWPERGS